MSNVPTFSTRLATWDSAHYMLLSQHGYLAGSHSCAFYPLWPSMIFLVSGMSFGHPLLAALLLANAFGILALWLFWRTVTYHFGMTVGNDALVLLLASPAAYFFSFQYTESLFLLLVLLFFWFLEREKYFWLVIVSFLMPLTKAVGVFIILPLAWHLLTRKKSAKHLLLLIAPILGYVTYFGIMYLFTGNAFEGFKAQKAFPNSPSIENMFDCTELYRSFTNIGSFDGMMDSFLDRAFFILYLVLLPMVWRLNRTWFWYVLAAGLVPALTSWFMSYRRYFLVCFPVFIVLVHAFKKPGKRWLYWYYVTLAASIQAWELIRFLNFYWAG